MLRRNTISPVLDFVVLPLEPGHVALFAEILASARAFNRDIIHVQIEKAGRWQFGAYDNFHPICVSWVDVDAATLDRLKAKGILKSYEWWPE